MKHTTWLRNPVLIGLAFSAMTIASLPALVLAAWQSAAPPATPPTTAPEPHLARPATIVPVPRDADWWRARHDAILQSARKGDATLAFLGDSITQGWEAEGAEVWNKHYATYNALNLGIGGDRTQHILWRLENGLLDAITQPPADANAKPNNLKTIVLMIGTNNSNGDDHSAEQIALGIKAIVHTLRKELPETKILLLAVFPRSEKPNAQREKNAKASELASSIADGKMIHYLDIGSKFLDGDGTLTKEIMPDALHLSPRGYEIWAEAINGKLAAMME